MTFGQWLWRRRNDPTLVGQFVKTLEHRRLEVPWKARDLQTWVVDIGVQVPSLRTHVAYAWRCYVADLGGYPDAP